jgi:serine/threonine protein phosphatase PrpC
MSGTDVKTAAPACAPPRPSPVQLLPSLSLRVAGRSECGPVRANNEDRFLAVRLERTTTPIATNIGPEDLRFVPVQTCWALAVADGMGGHAAGEVASTLALSRALELSQQGSRWFVSIGDEEAKEIMARLEFVLTSVDRAVSEHGSSGEHCAGMGTTLTAAAAAGDCLFVCHAGDSRIYLLRSGHLSRLTRDDTMAQELVDAGLMDADDMKKHPASHVLTQVIGRGDADFELRLVRLQHGDRLVLTTDGLTDALSDADLASIASGGDCDAACNALVDRALLAGAADNVTAIVADVDLAGG